MRNGLVLALTLTLGLPAAFAGRGGSSGAIKAAIASGSEDAIIAEVERTEVLVCMSCIDPVLSLVDHNSYRVRDVAGWWLGRRGVRDEVIANMSARLVGQDPVLARNAADVLGGMREASALPTLGAFLAKPLDDASGAAAARAIGNIGSPSGLVHLKAGATSSLPAVRAASLQWMRSLRSKLGAPTPFTLDVVSPGLADADASVRREAAFSAGYIVDKTAVSALANLATTDADASVRKAAVWALGQIGDASASSALSAALNDSDSGVRSLANGALARLK